MNSITLIALANIKRRVPQSLLVSSCIAISALLFATNLMVMNGMREPFDRVFNRLNASHLMLFFDQLEQPSDRLVGWLQDQPEVERVADPLPLYTVPEPLIYREQEIDLMIVLTERHNTTLIQDQVKIVNGAEKPQPAIGEIWIPNHLAKSHSIQIGDTLGIPVSDGLYELIVSATLIDPQYASGLFNPTRAWVAPGSLPLFVPVSKLDQQMLGVRVNSPEQIGDLWGKLKTEIKFEGHSLQYQLFKSAFLSFYNVLSAVLIVFSLMAILASIIVLVTTLNASIAADQRWIGIYKAQGLTPGDITKTYLLQNFLLVAAGLAIGLLGSLVVTGRILSSMLTSLGLVNLDYSYIGPVLLTVSFFIALSLFVTLVGGRKAGKLKAAEAIRRGSTEPVFSHVPLFGLIQHVPLPVFLGIRLIFTNKRRLIYTSLVLIFTIFILIFSINVAESFLGLKDNKPAWGLEDSDILLRLNQNIALPLEHDAFLQLIKQEEAVAVVVPYSHSTAVIPPGVKAGGYELHGKVYDGPMTGLGLTNLQGNHPASPNEISLALHSARDLSIEPGDSITLFLEGQRKNFQVTGIYQDVSSLGRGFRLPADAMRQLNPLYRPEFFALRLKKNTSLLDFKEHLQTSYAETVVVALSVEERKEIRSTITNMRSTLLLVSLFFLAILFLIMSNDTLMNVQELRYNFGILKTIGMTPAQIRLALVSRICILSLVSLAVGIPLALVTGPSLISQITVGIGLQEFPWMIHLWGIFLTIPGLFFFNSLSVWWASKAVVQVSPKILVLE